MKTYGDSTKTPGEHIDDRCYILAQFPETVNLDWARDLRGSLGGGELKYQKYLGLRHRIQADKQLWKRVLDGTSEATIVVIENAFYINAIAYRLKEAGAELGHDVTFEEILRGAALCMIEHAPVMRIPDLMPELILPTTLKPQSYSAAGGWPILSVFDCLSHHIRGCPILPRFWEGWEPRPRSSSS